MRTPRCMAARYAGPPAWSTPVGMSVAGRTVYRRSVPNRDVTEIRTYHDTTKHSVRSVYGGRHALDWETMPRPFKVYPDLEAIALPRDFSSSTRPALAALADAGIAPKGGPRLDRLALARLLYFSAGILR